MKRFRITILAVCLILAWLGYSDISLLLRNRQPQQISINQLEQNGPPREWLQITGGKQDLLQAINMSGSMNIDSFLVPLKTDAESEIMKVWFETRDPQIIEALKTYYFNLETDQQRNDFIKQNNHLFMAERTITGLTADNMVAGSNQSKLIKLLEEMNISASQETIFISQGKSPVMWRGLFYSVIALVGMIKIFSSFAKPEIQKQ